jgi:hypothetical protein
MSPVTDLTLSSPTYYTRADADPFFTRPQVAKLVPSYLGNTDPINPLASPLHGRLAGMPPVRIDVGDDEVLLDDSRRYVERAVGAGVDAKLDVWMGMPHGFVVSVGKMKAASLALDAIAYSSPAGYARARLEIPTKYRQGALFRLLGPARPARKSGQNNRKPGTDDSAPAMLSFPGSTPRANLSRTTLCTKHSRPSGSGATRCQTASSWPR